MSDAPTTQAEQEDAVREALERELADVIFGGGAISPRALANQLLAGPLARLIAERDDARGWANRNGNAARYWELIHGEKDKRLARAEAQRDQLAADLRKAREALKPFAEAAEILEGAEPDTRQIWESPEAWSLTTGDLRAARAALTPDRKDAGGTAKGDDYGA